MWNEARQADARHVPRFASDPPVPRPASVRRSSFLCQAPLRVLMTDAGGPEPISLPPYAGMWYLMFGFVCAAFFVLPLGFFVLVGIPLIWVSERLLWEKGQSERLCRGGAGMRGRAGEVATAQRGRAADGGASDESHGSAFIAETAPRRSLFSPPLQWNVRSNRGKPPLVYRYMRRYRGW